MVTAEGAAYVYDLVNQCLKPSLQLRLAAVAASHLQITSDGSLLLVLHHVDGTGWVYSAYSLEVTPKLKVFSPVRQGEPLTAETQALPKEVRTAPVGQVTRGGQAHFVHRHAWQPHWRCIAG